MRNISAQVDSDDGDGEAGADDGDEETPPKVLAAATVGAVVVPRNGHDGRVQLQNKLGKHVVEQFDRVGRRHGAVVHIARHEDDVGRFLVDDLTELAQEAPLVGGQVLAVKKLAEVPVGGVEEAHAVVVFILAPGPWG